MSLACSRCPFGVLEQLAVAAFHRAGVHPPAQLHHPCRDPRQFGPGKQRRAAHGTHGGPRRGQDHWWVHGGCGSRKKTEFSSRSLSLPPEGGGTKVTQTHACQQLPWAVNVAQSASICALQSGCIGSDCVSLAAFGGASAGTACRPWQSRRIDSTCLSSTSGGSCPPLAPTCSSLSPPRLAPLPLCQAC